MYVRHNTSAQSHTLTRELKISYTSEILTKAFTYWYWSTITVTSDSRIRPIAKWLIRKVAPIPILVWQTDNTTAEYLSALIPRFQGTASHTRCFLHIINLIARVSLGYGIYTNTCCRLFWVSSLSSTIRRKHLWAVELNESMATAQHRILLVLQMLRSLK